MFWGHNILVGIGIHSGDKVMDCVLHEKKIKKQSIQLSKIIP